MKLIDCEAHLITEQNPLKKIEMAGRTCYKSEKNITEDSAEAFVKSLATNKHYAMLEHAVFSFVISGDAVSAVDDLEQFPYFTIDQPWVNALAVTANLRAIHENEHVLADECKAAIAREYPKIAEILGWEPRPLTNARVEDPDTFPESIKLRHKHITFRFICDRGVTHELVRHRPVSFAQESTRYCNYAKKGNIDPEVWNAYEEAMKAYEEHLKDVAEQEARGNLVTEMEKPERPTAELTFIKPAGWDNEHENKRNHYIQTLEAAERAYTIAIENGDQPQQARALLPNAIKSEIIMTTSCTEWNHIFNLRYYGTTGKPHPDMLELMTKAFPIYQSILKA